MLERAGVESAQSMTAGGLVEIANLISENNRLRKMVAYLDEAALVVARFKAEVTEIGGYQNRLLCLHAGGVREYIDHLERILNPTKGNSLNLTP